MKIALVVNPVSGGKHAKNKIPWVINSLENRGVEADVYLSRYKGHIRKIARDLNLSEYEAVAAMGGDGTNFHMINGLLERRDPDQLPPLAVLPAGSGNSFARDLDILSLEQGIEAIARNAPRPVDLLCFSREKPCFYFVNLMGLGFVTDVARTAERFKRFGDFSYVLGILYRVLFLKSVSMELEVDGQCFSGPNCFVEFCNSRYTGGNMLMAPGARIDDGLMDIIIAGPMSRKRLVQSLPRIYSGTHVRMGEVLCIRGKNARIRTRTPKALLPDGEIWESTPGTVTIMAEKLKYLS